MIPDHEYHDNRDHLKAEILIGSSYFDRNTDHYRQAITIVKLIILRYSPDLKGGNLNVLAILFDLDSVEKKPFRAEQFADMNCQVSFIDLFDEPGRLDKTTTDKAKPKK